MDFRRALSRRNLVALDTDVTGFAVPRLVQQISTLRHSATSTPARKKYGGMDTLVDQAR